MANKSMDQFLFEYDERGSVNTNVTGHSKRGDYGSYNGDSFESMKGEQGSYERMVAILAGDEKFEYNMLKDQKMVRALVDSVKAMIKNRDRMKEQNKSVSDRKKELEAISNKTLEQQNEYNDIDGKIKVYQLQKTLMRYEKKLDELDDILIRIENGVNITDKTYDRYDDIVGDIEDSIFQETYVRKNLPYERGETAAGMKRPTAENCFPIKYRCGNGKTYHGIVRPPSGMITWEGKEARAMYLSDPDIRKISDAIKEGSKYSTNEILKIRITKDDFKVLSKESINNKLFSLTLPNREKKVEYNDSDRVVEAIKNYIFNLDNDGEARDVTSHSVMDGDIGNVIDGGDIKVKTIKPGIDSLGRPKDLTAAIDSIEFWRFIEILMR